MALPAGGEKFETGATLRRFYTTEKEAIIYGKQVANQSNLHVKEFAVRWFYQSSFLIALLRYAG